MRGVQIRYLTDRHASCQMFAEKKSASIGRNTRGKSIEWFPACLAFERQYVYAWLSDICIQTMRYEGGDLEGLDSDCDFAEMMDAGYDIWHGACDHVANIG